MNQDTTPTTISEIPFNELMEKYRKELKELGQKVLQSKRHSDCFGPFNATVEEGVMDKNEMIANITLSYRHIEDAIMRLGKAIQAHDGGVSIYDKK